MIFAMLEQGFVHVRRANNSNSNNNNNNNNINNNNNNNNNNKIINTDNSYSYIFIGRISQLNAPNSK